MFFGTGCAGLAAGAGKAFCWFAPSNGECGNKCGEQIGEACKHSFTWECLWLLGQSGRHGAGAWRWCSQVIVGASEYYLG